MSTVRDIESVVAIAMAQANFKVVTVPIHNAHDMHFFALYHLKQGRQAGRKTDFAGCHRLGGFFVEESVPPASGVLVFVDSIGTFDCRHLGMYIDGMVWGAGAIQQILATNGDTWLSFIRDKDGLYHLREEFTEPRTLNDDQNSDALGRHIWEHAVFQEKLHRALLPWKDIVNPTVLAAFANSSIMSLCWDMEENSSMSLVDDFTASLENELGIQIQEQKQNSRESTRLLLASVSVLERIGAVLAHKFRLPVKTTLPAGLVQCVERIQSRNIKSTIDPVDIIAEHLAKDFSPQRITEFCRVFWDTLPNGGVAWDTVSSLSDDVIDSHIGFLRSRLVPHKI